MNDLANEIYSFIQTLLAEKEVFVDFKEKTLEEKYALLWSYFDYEYSYFEEVYFLFEELLALQNGKENKAQEEYSKLQEKYRLYLDKKNSLKGIDLEKKYEEVQKQFIHLFQEMILYKKKEVIGKTLEELLLEIHIRYPFFEKEITALQKIFRDNALVKLEMTEYDSELYDSYVRASVTLNSTEFFLVLENIYKTLQENYPKVAYQYKEVEWKKGETYSKVVHREKENYRFLFQEMLDFRGVSYQKEEDATHLLEKIKKVYPFYYDKFLDIFASNPYDFPLRSVLAFYQKYQKEYRENYEEKLENYYKNHTEEEEFIDEEEKWS